MEKANSKIRINKIWKLSISLIVIVFLLLGFTNPNENGYYKSMLKMYGEPSLASPSITLERINFVVFSTYTPFYQYENGITHLGIMGTFIQISDGQFDYPFWLEFFN